MLKSDFSFELPDHLIAQYPPEQRGQSRLMQINRITKKISHCMVENLPEILTSPEFKTEAGFPLLVFNNSKVRKARLIGISSESGAKTEFLLLEKLNNDNNSLSWKVLVQRAKRRKPGSLYFFYDTDGAEIARAEIGGGEGEYRILEFDRPVYDDWLDRYGHIPLPPYIKRNDNPSDADRYQTVYASVYGSSAAPTAGLHFTGSMMEKLSAAGIDTAFITLHVGLGTFLPVRTEKIEEHKMHNETYTIDDAAAVKIETAKASGKKIIAVGTTSVRTLESAWTAGGLKRGEDSTSIFIYPGYRFNVADALFTNFHTPESTLLMLVSAFAGREFIMETYAEAIKENYRFFSYGDAMLIV